MALEKYFADFRKKQADLLDKFPDGFCFVVSVYNRDRNSTEGNIMQVSLENAARIIVEGTHRLATPAEVVAYRTAEQELRERLNAETVDTARRQFSALLGTQLGVVAPPTGSRNKPDPK